MIESVQSAHRIVSNTVPERPIRVLHVDDDQAFLKVAKQCLEMQGEFEVDVASSVNEALEKLEKTAYDAVVSDYQMPGKDGLQFLEELREKGNSVPFVVFTGKGREEMAIRALNLGADGYFDKMGQPETVYGELAHGIHLITEKKRTEKGRLHEEEKLRAILASSPDAIMVNDMKGTVVDCNEAALRLGGYSSKEDVVGRNALEFVSEKDRIASLESLKKISELGTMRNVEYTALKKNGETYLAEISGSILKNAAGNPTGFVSVIRDITERKKAEQEIRLKDAALASSIGAVAFADLEGNLSYVNNSFLRTWGYANDKEVLGRPAAEFWLSEEKAVEIVKALNDGVGWVGELAAKKKDGSTFEAQLSASLVKDETGKPLCMMASFLDITERKKAEKALKESEERFRAIFEGATDGIIAADVKTKRFAFANPRICEITGYSLEELLKLGVSDIIPKKDLPYVLDNIAKQMQGIITLSKDIPVLRKDEKVVCCDVNSKSIRIGIQEYLVGFFRDVTERKNAEDKLKESEEKYRSLVELAPDGIVSVNTEGIVTSVNRSFLTLVGQDSEEGIVGKPFTELKSNQAEDIPKFQSMFMSLMKGESPSPVEFLYVRKDGIGRWAEVHPGLLIKDGKPVGAQVIMRDVTERKNAEKQVQESQQKFEQLFMSNPDAAVYVDQNERVLDVNPRFTMLFGYSFDEVKGKFLDDFIVPEDRKKEAIMLAQKGKEKYLYYETVRNNKKGSLIPVALSSAPIVLQGQHLGDMVLYKDITERKKAEEALRETKDYLDNLLNHANAPIIVWDNEQKITLFNNAFEALTGYKKESMLGRNIDVLFPPLQKTGILQTIERATRGENWESVEVPILCKEKETRIALWNSANIQDKDGNIVATIAQGQDITERKALEDALKDAKQKWTSLTENTNDIVMIVDSEGIIQYINRTIPPYTQEETIGKTVYEYVPREQHDTLRSSLKKTFETGVPLDYVVSSNIPKTGTIWFKTKIVPVKDDKKTVSVILMTTDITELKNTGERLKETNMKLAVTNEKLHVVGGLTRHDVRNKLSALTGNAYLLRRKLAEDPKALEQLNDMETAVRLVEKIFEFARIYENLGTEQLVNIDVGEAVDGAVSLFSGLKGVKIVNECGGLTVLADSLLRQLFYNLIDNSLKYGEKIQQIKIQYNTLNADQLELVYEDDGLGIPDNMRSSLFRGGFSSGKGTGYGLFMIKRICEVYGWTIQETGMPGKGAKFTIIISRTNQNGKENYRLH
jgi:PAS domain S-box-containing protein